MLKNIAVIQNKEALAYWKGANPSVELTAERLEHIRQHHPEDFDMCIQYIHPAIEKPDLILEDHKNPLTAMFIRSFGEAGVNVVVRLTVSSGEANRNFIVTVHPVGERSIKKLERKNKVVYKRPDAMV